MKKVWKFYEQNKIEKPKLKGNKKIIRADLSKNISI